MPRGNSTPKSRAVAAAGGAAKALSVYLRATRSGSTPLHRALARVRESGRYDVVLRDGFSESSPDVAPEDVMLAAATIAISLRRGSAADLAPVYEGEDAVPTVTDALFAAVAREAKARKDDVPVDVVRAVWPDYDPEKAPSQGPEQDDVMESEDI
jgi:hypothetical protein